jgi:integrase
VQTLEGWLELGGYKLEDVHTLQRRLEAAKLGQSKRRVKDQEKYIKELEDELRQMQRRIAAWEAAKANMDANDTLFLSFGRPHPESFGKPLNGKTFWLIVTTAIANATKHFFGQSKPLNPHRFRHIAIKHCIEIQGNLDALAAYMNHSRETQKKYLDQIFSVYNYTKDFVDDWCKNKL